MSIDLLPPARPSWTRFIVDYNPCFLLSAICMLVGCRILNDAINSRPGDIAGACWLVLTINVYEFSLLGVAWLIRSLQGMRRDVGILVVVASLFLSDIVFVVGDLSTTNADLGIVMAGLLTLFAVPKAWITLRLIGPPKAIRMTAMVAGLIAMIVLLPAVLKKISLANDGFVSLQAIYAAWWVLGAMPIIAVVVLGYRSLERLGGLAIMYLLVPYLVLIGHLLACTWVFKLPFYAACYAPVLLGIAVSAGMLRYRIGRDNAVVVEWLATIAAVVLASRGPASLITLPYITPLRLTALAAAVVNVHGLMVTRHLLFALTLGGLCVGAIFGPLWPIVTGGYRWIAELLTRLGRRLTPRTNAEWGMVAVGISFALLLLGMVISLWKRPSQQND
jgi:hypothetical protein